MGMKRGQERIWVSLIFFFKNIWMSYILRKNKKAEHELNHTRPLIKNMDVPYLFMDVLYSQYSTAFDQEYMDVLYSKKAEHELNHARPLIKNMDVPYLLFWVSFFSFFFYFSIFLKMDQH